MGKKKRMRHRTEPVSRDGTKKNILRLAGIPLGTLVALFGLMYTYKSTGSDELRAKVYQPLFADLIAVKESVQSVGVEKPPSTKALPELKQSGAFERVPFQIQLDLQRITDEASKIHLAVLTLNELVLREISSRIMQTRTETIDRDWHQRTSHSLLELSQQQKGIGDSVTQSFTHEARSRTMDLRNPQQPVLSGPGGPTFVVRDWLTYPESLRSIETLWSDLDYLYFNPRIDRWYWQLTREDLKRSAISLERILTPVHQVLSNTQEFKYLVGARQSLLADIAAMEATLTERIRDPKQIRDLFSR